MYNDCCFHFQNINSANESNGMITEIEFDWRLSKNYGNIYHDSNIQSHSFNIERGNVTDF